MRFLVPFLLILAATLPGCATPSEGKEGPPPLAGPVQAFVWHYNATDCQEAMVLLLLPKDELQRHLPDGFVVGDATKLVSPDIPGGAADRGVLFANSYMCAGTDVADDTGIEGQVGVLIESPMVEGERPVAVFDFYELARVTPSADQRERFDAIGWPALDGNITTAMTGSGGTGRVEQEGALAWSMEVTLPGSQAFSGIARFWHAPSGGIAYADYALDATQLVGSVECEIAEGSVLATFTDIRTCGPGNAVGSGFESFDPAFSLTWLPKATAEV